MHLGTFSTRHQTKPIPPSPNKKTSKGSHAHSSIKSRETSLRGHTNQAYLTLTKSKNHYKHSSTNVPHHHSPKRSQPNSPTHSFSRSDSQHTYVEVVDQYGNHYAEIKPYIHSASNPKYHEGHHPYVTSSAANHNYSRGTHDRTYTQLQGRPKPHNEYTELNKIQKTPGVRNNQALPRGQSARSLEKSSKVLSPKPMNIKKY